MNYLYLPGTVNNWATTPNTNALQITGDIDLRWYGALANWTTPATTQVLMSHEGANFGYRLHVTTTGTVTFTFSENNVNNRAQTSTVSVPFGKEQQAWVRATRTQADGNVNFYTSTDGVTWTQLGATRVGVTGAMILDTTQLAIGQITGGSGFMNGKVFYAEVRNGVNGIVVASPDFRGYVSSGFSDAQGNVWTVNSTGANPSAQLIQREPANYFFMPGHGVNYAGTPDALALRITGDIDVRAYIAPADWRTPFTFFDIAGKWASAPNHGWIFYIDRLSGKPTLQMSSTGSDGPAVSSSVATGFSAETAHWVRVTRVASSGLVTFYTSSDGTTWQQLGTQPTLSAGNNIFASTNQVEVGTDTNGTGDPFSGKIHYVEIRNGINGTIVANPNFRASVASGFSDAQGRVWTINTSGSPPAALTQRTLAAA